MHNEIHVFLVKDKPDSPRSILLDSIDSVNLFEKSQVNNKFIKEIERIEFSNLGEFRNIDLNEVFIKYNISSLSISKMHFTKEYIEILNKLKILEITFNYCSKDSNDVTFSNQNIEFLSIGYGVYLVFYLNEMINLNKLSFHSYKDFYGQFKGSSNCIKKITIGSYNPKVNDKKFSFKSIPNVQSIILNGTTLSSIDSLLNNKVELIVINYGTKLIDICRLKELSSTLKTFTLIKCKKIESYSSILTCFKLKELAIIHSKEIRGKELFEKFNKIDSFIYMGTKVLD